MTMQRPSGDMTLQRQNGDRTMQRPSGDSGYDAALGRALLTETNVESGDVSKQKWNLC